MRKILRILVLVLVIVGLAIPVCAATMEVCFTKSSSFELGGKVTVDKEKTMKSLMKASDVTSEIYNAYLEGNVQYYWYRNGQYYKDGKSITLKEADAGCSFYCQAVLYSDADHIQQCGYFTSAEFTVPEIQKPIPEITTKKLNQGTVGEAYYQKLECSDPDVTFELLQSSLPDGMYITQHGEIEGTPTTAGFYYVVVLVTNEFGETNTAEYELTIQEAPTEPAAPETVPSQPPATTEPVETVPAAALTTVPVVEEEEIILVSDPAFSETDLEKAPDNSTILIVAIIAATVVALAGIAAFVVVKLNGQKRR